METSAAAFTGCSGNKTEVKKEAAVVQEVKIPVKVGNETALLLKDLETLEMEPELATSWSVADDDKTWTVNLRQGVMWHDGTEFTAADVKFTYTAAMAEELASQTGAFVEAIIGSPDNIEIVNDLNHYLILKDKFPLPPWQ